MATVSIVEDDPSFAELLAWYVRANRKLKLLSISTTGEQGVDDIIRHKPQVALMDIKLPHMSGIECLVHLKQFSPPLHARILMLTDYADSRLVFESLQAGAFGYLLKDHTQGKQLYAAVQGALAGIAPITPTIAQRIMERFQSVPNIGLNILSERQKEVLERLSHGLLNKQIADELGIKPDTVGKHVGAIYEKLQVHSRAEAIRHFLGHPPPP
jgi:DNA-binding NarL/FixJ family response regulator